MLELTKEYLNRDNVYKEVVKALGKVDSNGSWDTLLEECDYDIDRAINVAYDSILRIVNDDILINGSLDVKALDDLHFYIKQLNKLGRCLLWYLLYW